MNRYAATGIAFDAEYSARRIIVLTHSTTESRHALDLIAEDAPEGATIQRANGLDSIRYPSGGRVIVRSRRQGTRGYTADAVYLDAGVDAELSTKDWASINASVIANRGEIIRA